jgi:hypothetical protein
MAGPDAAGSGSLHLTPLLFSDKKHGNPQRQLLKESKASSPSFCGLSTSISTASLLLLQITIFFMAASVEFITGTIFAVVMVLIGLGAIWIVYWQTYFLLRHQSKLC